MTLYISRVSGVPDQHDPDRWSGLIEVGALLIRHGTARQKLKGKCLLEYGPNHAHVGGHRQDTRGGARCA